MSVLRPGPSPIAIADSLGESRRNVVRQEILIVGTFDLSLPLLDSSTAIEVNNTFSL
ncbi:hypothetical protein KOR42_48490 [Thalassoglobus neptunius]|uniref:Uncharacterized protein n=1 Tax=Thalassoglobus neptunius TaxID=1938619 RepID=A0A5C5VRZ5_9PLAN|nr:hypothetical protein KOR42_48490 [Thalassoglobus neptunius]